MLRDFRKNKIFNRRTFIIGAVQSILIIILITRLAHLQLWKHKEYSIQSDSNRIKPIINPAPRGTVFDRNGIALTKNESNYRLLLYLRNKKNIETSIDRLVAILDLGKEGKENFMQKIKNARRKSVISLIDNLGWDDLARIETHYHQLPGVSIESGVIRKYPYPNQTSHFLGYVSLPSEREIDGNEQALFMHPDFRIGKFGIEKSFDKTLRGKYGVKYVEVNAHELPLRTLSVKKAKEGAKLHLTIDFELQKYISEKIKDIVASIVVMDVKTGEILAYASSPSFNPNNFVEGVTQKYWNQINQSPDNPLNNKPIAAIYPPGSTFKLMVAIAALEAGVNPNKKVFCNGSYRLGKRRFHCWKEQGHGHVNMMDAIMHSCNTYFYNLAHQIGYEKFMEVASRFGYGKKFNINLSGGSSGNLPSDAWKQKVLDEPWVGGDTLNAAIGQGFVLATPLQMAVVTSRIANGGVPIEPYLIKNKKLFNQYEKLSDKKIAQKSHIDLIKKSMFKVVNEKGGTAYWQRIRMKGFEMAGKTGTSQVISKREKNMTKEEMKRHSNHAIFVGYAPFNDPKYAISVVVEHGGSGSATAAPIARDIMKKAQGLIKTEPNS